MRSEVWSRWIVAALCALVMVMVARPASGQVTPDGTWTDSLFTSTSGHTASFNVMPTEGPDFADYDLVCQAQGGISCSVTSPQEMVKWMDNPVDVSFSTSAQTGDFNVWLYVSSSESSFQDSGYRVYTVVAPVQVTALDTLGSVMLNQEDLEARFEVKNTGSSQDTFSMTCEWGASYCASSPDSRVLDPGEADTVMVTFDAGAVARDHELRLTAETYYSSASAYDAQTVTVDEYLSVNAVAEKGKVYAEPSTATSANFALRFPGQQTGESFDLSVSCTGLTGCSAPSDTLVSDTEVLVPVSFTPGSNGTTGTFTLTATKTSDSSVTASGTVDVVATSDLLLSVAEANPGFEELRGECVTAAAGPGRIECDDFVYHHGFTPVVRMNRPYELGLYYNSGHTSADKVVGANFVLPPGTSEPSSVAADLKIGGATEDSDTYGSGLYATGENTRLAFELTGLTANAPIDYDVTLTPSGQSATTESDTLLSVVRNGPFGTGWWMAGLEKLEVQPDDLSLLWIGGDGSARLYSRSSTSDPFVAETRMRADTITESGSTYVRNLIGGGQVHYESDGDHFKTVNREGVTTEFVRNGEQVDTVKVEGEALFTFEYTSGLLTKVRVLSKTGGWDDFTVAQSSGTISSITAPDSRDVRFGYRSADDKLETITTDVSSTGSVTSTVSYTHQKVSGVTTSDGSQSIAMSWQPAAPVGSATSGTYVPAVVETVAAVLDGPRTDVTDQTTFYVNGWGATRGLKDAEGNETWIDRDDESHPGLPTRVRHPNGWQVEAEYYAGGLLQTVTDRSTGGVTTYEWNTTWSKPTKIISPEGIDREYRYDASGNRTVEKIHTDSVTYAYNANNQVTSITDPQGNTTTLEYFDSTTGNLKKANDPADGWTQYQRDSRGYPDSVLTADSILTVTHYDAMVRTDSVRTSSVSSGDPLWRTVEHTYDAYTGHKIKTEAFGFTPDTTDADAETTTGATEWLYDAFGRMVREDKPAASDSLVYDAAGNVTKRILLGSTSSHTIEVSYDALNRRDTVIVPAKTGSTTTVSGVQFPYWESEGLSISGSTTTIHGDTLAFAYDVMGNMTEADNRYARIDRAYYLNGALKTDKQTLRKYSSATDFSLHAYELAFNYDLDGRRTAVHHPTWLSDGSDRTTYAYDIQTGRLTTVTDDLGSEYAFTYNGNGQPTQLSFPNSSGSRTLSYDAAGRVDTLSVSAGGSFSLGGNLTYDKAGRVVSAAQFDGTASFTYDGLGQVSQSKLWLSGSESREDFERDAFGSATFQHSWPSFTASEPGSAFDNTYNLNGGSINAEYERWKFDDHPSEPNGWTPGSTNYGYDGRGNVIYRSQVRYDWEYTGTYDIYDDARRAATHEHQARSYYSADDRLVLHQVTRDSTYHDQASGTDVEGDPWGAWEEYWYDALGRRVLKRTRQSTPICSDASRVGGDRCDPATERFVWDGEQILWELRSSSTDIQKPTGSAYTGQTGTIGYIHVGGIDQPIGMVRNGNTLVLHRGWRGSYEGATTTNGDEIATDVPWPGNHWKTTGRFIDPREKHTWVGSLPMGQADQSGLTYRRNRYYDPSSGQFTQQDPIGIAGGLNVYGFANGDPVNFSDPFGLKPDCEERKEVDHEGGTQAKSQECEEGLLKRLRAWRARKNQSDLTTPDEVSAAGGYEAEAWMNVFHQNGGAWDTKMLLPDGRISSKEFIFDGDSGALMTGSKGGTYNIVNPIPPDRGSCSTQFQCYGESLKMFTSWTGHVLLDVVLQ